MGMRANNHNKIMFKVGVDMGATGKNAPDSASPLDLNQMSMEQKQKRGSWLPPSWKVDESGVGMPRTGVLKTRSSTPAPE